MRDLKTYIRDVPSFTKAGIMFRDITPLLANGPAWHDTVGQIAERYRNRVDIILGVESRGFLIGSAVAYALGCGIAVVRKSGKLPAAKFNANYALSMALIPWKSTKMRSLLGAECSLWMTY